MYFDIGKLDYLPHPVQFSWSQQVSKLTRADLYLDFLFTLRFIGKHFDLHYEHYCSKRDVCSFSLLVMMPSLNIVAPISSVVQAASKWLYFMSTTGLIVLQAHQRCT